ncbi:MAG: ABC transporter permease [Acidobacteriota bacterium]
MANLAIANLSKRKTRTLVSILAVAIEITLILVLVGLTKGTLNDVASRIQNIGADILFLPPGASSILSLNNYFMHINLKESIITTEGVKAVSPVMTWMTNKLGGIGGNIIFGIDRKEFNNVGGNLELLSGKHLQGEYDMLVDRRLAEANNLRLNDQVEFLNHQFTVVGILKAGVGARIYIPLTTLQNALNEPNRVSLFFVKCQSPEQVGEVASQLEKSFPGYQTQLSETYAQDLAESARGINQFISAITVIAILVSFLVILLAMYTTIIERTREIGILKALGATKAYIVKTIVTEAVALSIIGILCGYLLSFAAQTWMSNAYPLITIIITPSWLILAGILGLVSGFLGSLYPSYRAATLDPVEALNYE